jgi:hypothetical protein
MYCRHLKTLFSILFLFACLGETRLLADTISDDVRRKATANVGRFLSDYCRDCHSAADAVAGFEIESLLGLENLTRASHSDSVIAEKLLRRLIGRQMPPIDAFRPSDDEYDSAIDAISELLAERANSIPPAEPSASIRRLTRIEYQNAIRDLFGLQIDATELLPDDPLSHGFDNITVSDLSAGRLYGYLSAAEKVARQVVGAAGRNPVSKVLRLPADRTQENHVEGLPLGTRGGTQFDFLAPLAGKYQIAIRLTRDRDEMIEGLTREHAIDVLVDRQRQHQFTVEPPADGRDFTLVDANLVTLLSLTQGKHSICVTFPMREMSIIESQRQPFDASFNRHRHPRRNPAIYQVTLLGPITDVQSAPPTNDQKTATHDAAFPETPRDASADIESAVQFLQPIVRKAFRRPISEADLAPIIEVFKAASHAASYQESLQAAVAAVLVNPNFLLRVEHAIQPVDVAHAQTRKLSGETDIQQSAALQSSPVDPYELATRLSFFLWSSIPDEQLLDRAEELSTDALGLENTKRNAVVSSEVQRMLADKKSRSLSENFAGQWLYLRNLDTLTPDLRAYPDFDDNLRQAFKQETQLLFRDVVERDASVLELLNSKHTFLNARLAQHYDIPNVVGDHFRRVDLPADSRRGGLLRHGSILSVTSYATRTSPTVRGNWILKNLLGTAPPPPPPNIPNLEEKSTLVASTVRERLTQHRADPSCAACHNLMDPLGFALENFDAVGRYREYVDTLAIDSDGQLPNGLDIDGVDSLESGILERPQLFVITLTEKLMTFALGRGLVPNDGPTIRKIVEQSAESNYRFSSLIQGIVQSDLFQNKQTY